MRFSTHIPLALASVAGLAQAATKEEWATRSIYQVITDRFALPDGSSPACNISNYCGGTWSGIVNKLDYIQDMGFTAIQISPVNENFNSTTIYGEAYHGYWPVNLYALNSHFGSDADLKNLSAELHARDMYLLMDVVANEMAFDLGDHNMTDSTVIDYSDFYPFNNAVDYNPYCPILDWSNMTQYQNCWLGTEGVATPHLALSNSTVTSMLGTWIKELVSNYSIDGIRIDGAKQIEYSFFEPFLDQAGVYAMAEVDDGEAAFTCNYQNMSAGLENYPLYYTIIRAFTAGEMSGLVDMIGSVRNACPDTQYLATFIENQDNERFASYVSDIVLAENAIAFTILADGIPKIYYGQEQHLTGLYAPYNRQDLWGNGNYDNTTTLYNLTSTLNKLRNHALSVNSNYATNTSSILYTDDSTYAARKGPNGVQIVSVLSNQGVKGGSYELSVPGAADKGTNMTEIFGCTTVVAGNNGTIVVDMDKGAPKVFFPTFNLKGSGLCGESTNATATVGSGGSKGTTTSASASTSSTKKSGAADLLTAPIFSMMGLAGVLSFALL